jgi:hypothetical protein
LLSKRSHKRADGDGIHRAESDRSLVTTKGNTMAKQNQHGQQKPGGMAVNLDALLSVRM